MTNLTPLPLPHAPDTAPLAALRQRPSLVCDRDRNTVIAWAPSRRRWQPRCSDPGGTAGMSAVSWPSCSPCTAVTGRRRSLYRIGTPVAVLGRSEAVTETLGVVVKSRLTPSPAASKTKATVTGLFTFSHPGTPEPATANVSATVADSDSINERVFAYVATPIHVNPMPGATRAHAKGAARVVPIMRRQSVRRLNDQGGAEAVSQIESRSYRMADNVRSMRRSHLRIASRDGVVDADEQALDDALVRLGDELEQKADDERAALALIRIGRTKHTRGIVVDLFPNIGGDAA